MLTTRNSPTCALPLVTPRFRLPLQASDSRETWIGLGVHKWLLTCSVISITISTTSHFKGMEGESSGLSQGEY
jgi:hypothetical protein